MKIHTKFPAVVLAGGLSSRMGQDHKCLLPLKDKTILQHTLESIQPYSEPILLNVNSSDARYPQYGLTIVKDKGDRLLGPLSGISSALHWVQKHSQHTHLLSVPSDCPFLPKHLVPQFLNRMAEKSAEVYIARSGNQDHYTIGVWSLALLDKIDEHLASKKLSVGKFIKSQDYDVIEFPIGKIDPFFNINTPSQYESAKLLVEKYFP